MSDNKHDAIMDWLWQNEDVKRLYFNFSDTQTGNIVVATNSGNYVMKRYLDGSSMRAYDFAMIQYKPLNTVDVNSTENAETMFDAEQLMEWVDEQEQKHNYPRFENCTITKVENLHNMPQISGIDDTVAKYRFSCRVTYLQKPKRTV